ncbi:MAG: cupin domain-containing protein [Alphaproteobacteria bacterium]|nr:cupin domain-containing protein [Alphaproteobacteria bacterium]
MSNIDALIDAMAATFRACPEGHPGTSVGRAVAERLDALDRRATDISTAPRRVPAADTMDGVLDGAERGPGAALARALRPVLSRVAWHQTYTEAELGPDYLRNYGYFDIASPARGLIRTDALATGFMVIGPGRLYPAHYHPAVELYHVVAGAPDWSIDDGPWQSKPAGSFVFHPTMAVHAMRTGDRPFLALYAWLGDLNTSAKLGRPVRD